MSALGDKEAAALEVPITLNKVQAALDKCKNNKAPGLDGLSYEFYKSTLNMIGPK